MTAPTTGTADAKTPPRGRRASRMSADDRERAIVTCAEDLLNERALHDISVDDLARGAGISRSAFYFYFSSKEQVLLSLLDRLLQDQLQDERHSPGPLEDDPAGVWRHVLGASFARWSAHRGVLRATLAASATSPEVREVLGRLLGSFVDRTEIAIQAERARGAAPDGVPARDLAVCLVRMNEKVFEVMAAGEQPAVAEAETLEALVGIWLTAIYGTVPFAISPTGPRTPASPTRGAPA